MSVQHIKTNEYKQYDMILKNLLCEVYQEGLFKMEMCYDGALVMPKSFAVVSNDEMTYVDGGTAKNFGNNLKGLWNKSQDIRWALKWFQLGLYLWSCRGIILVCMRHSGS